MSILCRLGLHDWEPIFEYRWVRKGRDGNYLLAIPDKVQVASQCRRCGKRVAL